jgi:hypothetical protein
MMKHLFLILLLLATARLHAMPAKIVLIHHAEKATQGHQLSLKGRERAAALVPYFIHGEGALKEATPVAIYTTAASKGNLSSLCIDTVKPLAQELQLSINDTFDASEFKKMAEEIKSNVAYNGKTVLICWDNATIPDLTRFFGALQSPNRWLPETYDRVWLVTISPTGKASIQNLPQKLMFGDSAY